MERNKNTVAPGCLWTCYAMDTVHFVPLMWIHIARSIYHIKVFYWRIFSPRSLSLSLSRISIIGVHAQNSKGRAMASEGGPWHFYNRRPFLARNRFSKFILSSVKPSPNRLEGGLHRQSQREGMSPLICPLLISIRISFFLWLSPRYCSCSIYRAWLMRFKL